MRQSASLIHHSRAASGWVFQPVSHPGYQILDSAERFVTHSTATCSVRLLAHTTSAEQPPVVTDIFCVSNAFAYSALCEIRC